MTDQKGNESNQNNYVHMNLTERELQTLKTVLFGYLGFLRNLKEPNNTETQTRLQAIYDRLSQPLTVNEMFFFNYEERVAIHEATLGFKFLLVTLFPHTPQRDVALAEVERLYQCLIRARPLPLN